MLERGDIDALMMPHPPDEVVGRVGEDPPACSATPAPRSSSTSARTDSIPIMHVVAFKNEVLEKYPFAVQSVTDAFEKAKAACFEYYSDPNWSSLVWTRHLYEEESAKRWAMDYWPYGLRRNRANLERFMGYSHDQGLMAKAGRGGRSVRGINARLVSSA